MTRKPHVAFAPADVRQGVFETLQRIAPQVSPDALNPARPLRDQVDLDSMDWLNFLVAVNERFGADIPESDYAQLATLDDLFAYLERRHAGVRGGRNRRVREHRLADGRTVTIRPIRADDAERIRDLLEASSEESRYKRFQKWVHAPSNELVHFLTDVDERRCVTAVASVPSGSHEQIVGEARCIAGADGKSCELGLLVEDSWQKTGIAGLLMEALMKSARERGFTEMEGLVLANNAPMLQFAHAFGFEAEPTEDRTMVHIRRVLRDAAAPMSRPVGSSRRNRIVDAKYKESR